MAGKPYESRGRKAPTLPPPFPGKPAGSPGDYRWKPPATGALPPLAPPTPLAQLIELYRLEQPTPDDDLPPVLSAEMTRQLDVAESRHWEQESDLTRAGIARQIQRADPDAITQANLNSRPKFIRQPLQRQLDFIRAQMEPARTSAFLREHVESVLARLDTVISRQMTIAYRQFAGRERLDDLLRLPQLGRRSVKTLATLIAAHMELQLDKLMPGLGERPGDLDFVQLYNSIAADAARLCITPPSWDALNMNARKRGDFPVDKIPGALGRLTCADWWEGKLWRLRSEWREEQMRAICQVSATASAFVSHDALNAHREQRRKNTEFLKAHELINDDGVTLNLEDVYYASASSPAKRRIEMMATMKGMEQVAELRGDCAIYCTITTPSKFHATLNNGKPNPKWNASTVRESSDYLVDMFSSVRKKLNRQGLRWYGVRVAEPHHDGTVHWHLVIFMRKKDRQRITAILREFSIREDRAELGRNTRARFDCGVIDARKGSPTSYIAAYIGKNIDGAHLKDRKDKDGNPMKSDESGQDIAATVENAVAWASLHRVRQFQFFGIPSRQAYRELRLLATQLQRSKKPKKGERLLTDPAMDAVLAAADVGCVATYIMKQGGVLIPRKLHTVRTAYSPAEKPNDYGEIDQRIFGVWSPALGERSRICTHGENWQLVRKKPARNTAAAPKNGHETGFDFDRQGGPSAPWTRGINCPSEQKPDETSLEDEQITAEEMRNPALIKPGRRRALIQRLRKQKVNTPSMPQEQPAPPPAQVDFVRNALDVMGYTVSADEIATLLRGSAVHMEDGEIVQLRMGVIRTVRAREYCRTCSREYSTADLFYPEACTACAAAGK